jgi:argininosuccinate lyase
MSTAQFDRQRLAARAGQGWITVTELADTLTREHGVPFRKAHEIATLLVQESAARPDDPLERVLGDVSSRVLAKPVVLAPKQLEEILSPARFVRVRTTLGGPAPSETARARDASSKALEADQAWLSERLANLLEAEARLNAAAAAL